MGKSNLSSARIGNIIQKQTLWAQIKRLGDLWGENEEFTREIGKSIYDASLEVLEVEAAIECFKDLICQGEQIGTNRKSCKH